jgi:hypothetical protein
MSATTFPPGLDLAWTDLVVRARQRVRRRRDEDRREVDFRFGTLPPARRAWDRPIAIACFRLVTFLPERPLRSFPRFRSRIAFSTFLDASFPYLAMIRSSST